MQQKFLEMKWMWDDQAYHEEDDQINDHKNTK